MKKINTSKDWVYARAVFPRLADGKLANLPAFELESGAVKRPRSINGETRWLTDAEMQAYIDAANSMYRDRPSLINRFSSWLKNKISPKVDNPNK